MEKKKQTTAVDLKYAKLPPQAIELEVAVLGAILTESHCFADISHILSKETFYTESHQTIYESICNLFKAGVSIDILTLVESLRKSANLEKIGGPYYIAQLTNGIASSANIEYHARIIVEKHKQRELILLGSNLMQKGYADESDAFNIESYCQTEINRIAGTGIRKKEQSAADIFSYELYQKIVTPVKEGEQTGVPSGFADLDRRTGGWQKTDLIILAARPGMGKTGLVANFATNAAERGYPVAVFSLEMSTEQLVYRMLSDKTEINSRDMMRRRQLAPDQIELLQTTFSDFQKLPLYIDDTPAISILELRSKCQRLKAQKGIQLVIVDYLQLMTVGGERKNGNREQDIAEISRSLKAMAKALDVSVIALSQLSRKTEDRGGTKEPQLSDLRESGAIEQDADMVMFIYRPEYYKIDQDADGNSLKGVANINIAKYRHGPTDDIQLRFLEQSASFRDCIDESYMSPPIPQEKNTLRNFAESRRETEEKPFF